MRSIGADIARAHFYRLLDEVADGDTILITKRGKPVAQLVSFQAATPQPDDVLGEMRAFRKGHALGGLSIRDLIDEGRK